MLNMKLMSPQSIFNTDPSDKHSDLIIESFLKDCIDEYRIAQDLDGIFDSQQRRDIIEYKNNELGYNKRFSPENDRWFRNIYRKWISLIEG